MFNVSTLFGQRKKRTNEILNSAAQNKVNETKALLLKGDWSTSEILINNLIRKHPYNADCCWLFGRLCANRGQFDAAIFHFKQCLQLIATHPDCYCSYGATLGLMKKYNEEEEMYKKCLELNPSHHVCHFNYGQLCEIRSDYKNAEKHFKEAIEGYGKDSNYYISYGVLLKTVRRYNEAQKQFEIAITIDSDNDNAHYLYAKLLQSMGNVTDAIKHLKKACKLKPGNKEYQRILHIMNRAKPRLPTIRKSESVSPHLLNNNFIATITPTPGGPDLSQSNPNLHELLYNNNINDIPNTKSIKSPKTRSLSVINDDQPTHVMKPPSVIKNDFSNINAPGAITDDIINDNDDNDEYFNKAVELYENKQYEESELILKLLITIKPEHEEAQRLYKYLSQKMYVTESNNNSVTTIPSIKETPETKDEDQETKKDDFDDDIDKDSDKDPCQMEFARFLEDRVKLNKQYPDLYERFEKLGYDNIRFIFDFDIETLTKEVNIKSLHCKTFMRKIEVFCSEANVFREWLKKIVSNNEQYASMDGLIDRLENKGILTFESLYRYVLTKQDLIKIIGKEFISIHQLIWSEIEKQQRDLMSAPTPNPAFLTPSNPLQSTPFGQSNNITPLYPGNDEGKTSRTALFQ